QQVEAGRLDLDAPVPAELIPINPLPDQPPVTLRLLLSHRSGLPRESPVGGYLDDSEPGIRRTVASMAPTVLVTRPGDKMRYS
ncbi:MAG TPA: serine hydrolase, partial [Verrucomicrobiales bacterium]|nr:serine hydrolase [Verrucomicrobiales bacterium]